MNDSAFRNNYWACYSTTLGSLLHEFSHILNLGHNKNGIMARGFDDIYTFFKIQSKECSCYCPEIRKVKFLILRLNLINIYIFN
jgi:hypothetical protein